MDNEYTSLWHFMTRNPAGQLALATALAIGISGICAAYVNYTPNQSDEKSYVSQLPEDNYREISDILK